MARKKLREARGLSQDALGKKVGMSYAYISMLESGTRTCAKARRPDEPCDCGL